jgi:hypothetical protein
MAFLLSYGEPSSPNPGDIWIPPDGTRQQWTGTAWQSIEPDPGFLPGGGSTTQHVAKAGVAFGQSHWVNAADGIVFTHTQTTLADTWVVTHRLVSQFVNVMVIDTSRSNMIMVPQIVFTNAMQCRLRFVNPVIGTALVRR